MKPESQARKRVIPLVFAAWFIAAGCAPTVATLDEDEEKAAESKSSQVAESGNEPERPAQSAREKLNIPAGLAPGEFDETQNQEIEATLAGMDSLERTQVILRFVSIDLVLYFAIYNHYPTAAEGLDVLLQPPVPPSGKAQKPLARELLLTDGWGNRVDYKPLTTDEGTPFYAVRSFGVDGIESGDDLFPEPDVEQTCLEATRRILAGELDDIR